MVDMVKRVDPKVFFIRSATEEKLYLALIGGDKWFVVGEEVKGMSCRKKNQVQREREDGAWLVPARETAEVLCKRFRLMGWDISW